MGDGTDSWSAARVTEETRHGHLYSTTDLPLMAYYIMNGLEIAKLTKKRGQGGGAQDFVFYFRDPDGKAEQLRIEWVNSQCRDFDNAVRSLKKLCHEARRAAKAGRHDLRRNPSSPR